MINQWIKVSKQTKFSKKLNFLKVSQMGQQIQDAFQGMAGSFQPSIDAKNKELAQRILNGEPKDQVLQGLPPIMRQNIEKIVAQMSQSANSSAQPYSLAQSQNWANSTNNPSLIEYVGKINDAIVSQGTQKYMQDLNLIMQAMNGDQNALQQILNKIGQQRL